MCPEKQFPGKHDADGEGPIGIDVRLLMRGETRGASLGGDERGVSGGDERWRGVGATVTALSRPGRPALELLFGGLDQRFGLAKESFGFRVLDPIR